MHAFIRLTAALLLGVILAPYMASAKYNPVIRLIRSGEPVSIAPDKAYAILQFNVPWSTISAFLMRVPSRDELEAYMAAKRIAFENAGKKAGPFESFAFEYQGSPNFYELPLKEGIIRSGTKSLVLAELPPGDYVLYGLGNGHFLYECLCFGTVGFTLHAGEVADLGTFLADKAAEKSTIPELAGATGLGRIAKMDAYFLAVGLRARQDGDFAVPGLDPTLVKAAQMRAIGPFIETNTLLATRLAPVAGVLAYKGGDVIDVVSGTPVSSNRGQNEGCC